MAAIHDGIAALLANTVVSTRPKDVASLLIEADNTFHAEYCHTHHFAMLPHGLHVRRFLDVIGAGFGTGRARGHQVSFAVCSQTDDRAAAQHLHTSHPGADSCDVPVVLRTAHQCARVRDDT